MTPKPVSWMKSPFRLTNPFEPGDLVEQLPSLRDVASEVQLKHVHPQRFEFMTMPEGHLMAHMAPGNIWEKGGVPYLTMGISRWDNTLRIGFDERTSGSEAMNSPNHPRHPGLLVEEPTLTAVIGHGRALRLLPKSGTNPNTLSEHGAVTYDKYPWTFICDEHGHISTGQRWNHDLGQHVCKKASCNSPSRPSRFVSLCTDGHMSPFDYHYWVHSGSDGCRDRNQLRLNLGPDAALTLSNWVIHCDACGKSRNMLGVPWVKSSDTHDAPKCNGRRDWLAGNNAAKEECDHRMVHRQVGNTSVTMNEGGSIMIIPPYTGWDFVDAEMVRRLQHSNNYEDFKQNWLDDLDHYSLERYLNDLAGTSYDRGDGDIDHESITQRLWAYHQQNSGDEILTLLNQRRERMAWSRRFRSIQ